MTNTELISTIKSNLKNNKPTVLHDEVCKYGNVETIYIIQDKFMYLIQFPQKAFIGKSVTGANLYNIIDINGYQKIYCNYKLGRKYINIRYTDAFYTTNKNRIDLNKLSLMTKAIDLLNINGLSRNIEKYEDSYYYSMQDPK